MVPFPAATEKRYSFADLTEPPDHTLLPWLDQPDLDVSRLSADQMSWVRDGIVIRRRFIPDALLDPYIAVREKLQRPGGWKTPQPYQHIPELKRLCLYRPLMILLRDLIGDEMLLHLNLTGWVSSERNWHQDDYLNPAFVNCWYAAVWIALGTITPESGPFEYLPGSHRWPLMRTEKVQACMTPEDHATLNAAGEAHLWPFLTEKYVVPAIEAEIGARGTGARTFLAEKGDVLIWHARLMHRGSKPAAPGIERRAVIAHYTALSHRPDVPQRAFDESGSAYACMDLPLHWPDPAPYW